MLYKVTRQSVWFDVTSFVVVGAVRSVGPPSISSHPIGLGREEQCARARRTRMRRAARRWWRSPPSPRATVRAAPRRRRSALDASLRNAPSHRHRLPPSPPPRRPSASHEAVYNKTCVLHTAGTTAARTEYLWGASVAGGAGAGAVTPRARRRRGRLSRRDSRVTCRRAASSSSRMCGGDEGDRRRGVTRA